MKNTYQTIDDYIKVLPLDIKYLLLQIRETIQKEAPEAEEGISYGMPAYKFHGKPLVYFAAFKKHIGFYATPTGHAAFAAELSGYKQGKGSVQLPIDKPLPLELIARMVRFRVNEMKEKL